MSSTVQTRDIEQFRKDSAHWWDEDGPFAPLHRLNPVRMRYIRSQIEERFDLEDKTLTPFDGLKILDIGCGGGLVSEPLCRLGADVTGLDADENAIDVARSHAGAGGLDIDYRACAAEVLLSDDTPRFDVVLALEIIEHVSDPDYFVKTCRALCKDSGLVIVSTLNRTAKSYLLGIVAAEYILGWVPRGTHDWNRFIKPSELTTILARHDLDADNVTGVKYNPLEQAFALSDDIAVNYFLSAAPRPQSS